MAVPLRVNVGLMPTRTSRRWAVSTRAYLTSEVPPHVQEARDWIASWKARQPPPAATPEAAPSPAAAAEVPPHVQEARDWIAAWKTRTEQPAPIAVAAREVPAPVAAQAALAPLEVPPNVLEARAWIAAWKAGQVPYAQQVHSSTVESLQPPEEEVAAKDVVPVVAVEAESLGGAAGGSSPLEPVMAADGTLTFSKSLLDGATYEDLLQALVAKEHRDLLP